MLPFEPRDNRRYIGFYQEGEVNTSDLADPMIMAIMTSRRLKRANAQNFRKWRLVPLAKQLLERASPLIAASNGVVFLSRTAIIVFLY